MKRSYTHIPKRWMDYLRLPSIWGFLAERPTSPNKVLDRNAVLHYRTIPVPWKKLPTKPWYRNGHKSGCGVCQHLPGQNREQDPKQSPTKPLVGKRYIDDVFSLWNAIRDRIESFIFERSVKDFDNTIKFTSEISETTTNILGHESVQTRDSILDVCAKRHTLKRQRPFNTRFFLV